MTFQTFETRPQQSLEVRIVVACQCNTLRLLGSFVIFFQELRHQSYFHTHSPPVWARQGFSSQYQSTAFHQTAMLSIRKDPSIVIKHLDQYVIIRLLILIILIQIRLKNDKALRNWTKQPLMYSTLRLSGISRINS